MFKGSVLFKKLNITSCAAFIFFFSYFQTPQVEASQDTILIGAALSFTGMHAKNGKHVRKGYELAKSLINEQGGISIGQKKYKLKIKYYDDESNPTLSRKLAKRLIVKDKVLLLLGPYSTATTLPVAEIADKYKVPLVQANGASLTLFNKEFKYMFAVLTSADRYHAETINLVATESRKQNIKPSSLKIAVAIEPDAFSNDVREGVLTELKKYNMKLVLDEKLPRDFKDMTFILEKVKKLKPDVFIVSGHENGADLAIRQIKEQKVYIPLLAMTHCEGADIDGKYGLFANYAICATQWSPTLKYKGKWFGSSYNYYKKFEAQYGYKPPYQAAESSAAVLVVADSLKRAGSLKRKKIRQAISQTNVQTFFGWIKFDATGKNIAKPIILRQLYLGKYLNIAPSGFAEHKVIYPSPQWSER